MKFFIILLFLAGVATARPAIEVLEVWETDPEGSKVESFRILADGERFSLNPPYNYSISTSALKREIQFSATNRTKIVIQFTDEFPGGLPDEAVLKNNVLGRYFGAAILRSAPCPTGIAPGWMIDVKRVFTPEISLVTRHVFIPWTHGTIQFTLSADSEDFEQHRQFFGNLINSFRSDVAVK